MTCPHNVGFLSFHRWANWGTENLSNLPRAHSLSDRAGEGRLPSCDNDLNDDSGRDSSLDQWARCLISFLSVYSRNNLIPTNCQGTQGVPGGRDMGLGLCSQGSISQPQVQGQVSWASLDRCHIPPCPDPWVTGGLLSPLPCPYPKVKHP